MIIGKDTELGQKIDRLSRQLCRTVNGITGHYVGFLPTAIARELAPERLGQIADQIADAKMAVGKPVLDLFYYKGRVLC
jgi:hypothetical protein